MKQFKLQEIISAVGTFKSLILHTIFFLVMLSLPLFFGVDSTLSLLILTTVVSLEAIYLNIITLMGVNRHADEQAKTHLVLSNIEETIDDIEETIDDVQETIEDVQETIDEEETQTEQNLKNKETNNETT